MTTSPASPIAVAKQRHRIAEVAARTGLFLPVSAGIVTVRCPLPTHGHPDRTPSMRLYLGDDRYYCFGCGAKADVVQWVRDAEGLGVAGAIRALDEGQRITNAWAGAVANKWGPVGTRRAASSVEGTQLARSRPGRLQAAMTEAWTFYAQPPLHDAGVAYLARRGIEVGAVEAHNHRTEVGHTPAAPAGLTAALRARGFSHDELVDAGLSRRSAQTGELVDFFRIRVLIPVRDGNGKVRGPVGRNVGGPRQTKYTNSPRTALYDKSLQLYQPFPFPEPNGAVVAVEGPLDALAVAAAALDAGCAWLFCPLTQSGRELSDMQVRTIAALHPGPVVLGFDADDAGRDSTARYTRAFAGVGRRVLVARLPDGHDPASWLQHTGSAGLVAWQPGRLQTAARNPGNATVAHLTTETADGVDL